MSTAAGIGSVVTFYSWKGGVGRTLALANTAVQLARAGRKVLMIDWDLEAPGLYQYFLAPGKPEAARLSIAPAQSPGGLWSLLQAASERANGDLDILEWTSAIIRITVPSEERSIGSPYVPTPGPLDFLPAGHEEPNYSEQLGVFSWNEFFRKSRGGEWLEAARRQWIQSYDFVLIDSRTGLTDSGGVCTIQLPDTLVLVFSANDQSFAGGMKIVGAAQKARRDYGHDRGQLIIIPLLSRWEGDKETDIAAEWMQRFDRELTPIIAAWLPRGLTPQRFLERVRVPHVARFSFGEPLPVLTHSLTDPALPGLAFDNLARLLGSDMAESGKIIDPTYDPPRPYIVQSDGGAPRYWSFAADPAALQRELGKVSQLSGPESEEMSSLLAAAGRTLFEMARYADAEPLLRRALAIDERRLGPEHPDVATHLNNLGELLRATNRLAEAEPIMLRALALGEASLGPDHPTVAIRLNNLALLLEEMNRPAEAEPLMTRALAIDEGSLGPDHPNVAVRLNNLASLLQNTNRVAAAEPLYRRAIAIAEASLGPDHPYVATCLSNLSDLLKFTGRLSEAEHLLRRALAIDEASLGPDHPNVANRLNNLAALLQQSHRLPEAEPLARRALTIHEASFGPAHPNVASDLSNLALLLLNIGRSDEAEALMRRALAIVLSSERVNGRAHPDSEVYGNNYRRLLKAVGRDEEEINSAMDGVRHQVGLN